MLRQLNDFFKVRLTSNARLIAALIAISLGAYGVTMIHWLEKKQQREIQISPREKAPDYFVTQARYFDFQPQVQEQHQKDLVEEEVMTPLRLEIKSKTLSHFTSTKETQFVEPVIELTDKSRQTWIITAKNGFASRPVDSNAFLSLQGDVLVTSLDNQDFSMQSDELKIDPQQEIITTEAAIRLDLPDGQVSAGGFESQVDKGQIKLYKGVSAVYNYQDKLK